MKKFGQTDYSKFPIVTVTLDEFEPTAAEFDAHLQELSEIISSSGVVLILNISHAKFLPSNHRIAAGKWLKKETETMKKNVRGMVFVNNSIAMSLILKGVFLVSRPAVDHLVSKSLEEALKWAYSKLEASTKAMTCK